VLLAINIYRPHFAGANLMIDTNKLLNVNSLLLVPITGIGFIAGLGLRHETTTQLATENGRGLNVFLIDHKYQHGWFLGTTANCGSL
jgi:hypothetical protein